MKRASPSPKSQGGFVLIGVLIALAVAALMVVNSGQRMADTRLRANEEELLNIGEQYRLAIQSYWRQSPGPVRSLPTSLDQLVQDPRFPQPRRHLRKLYPDPLAPQTPWGVLKSGNAIIGVFSQAEGVPFRQVGFTEAQPGFDHAERYADWHFAANVLQPQAGTPRPGLPGPGLPARGAAPAPAPRGTR